MNTDKKFDSREKQVYFRFVSEEIAFLYPVLQTWGWYFCCGMCLYCFLSEPPAEPRSIRRQAAEAAQEVCLRVDEVMECVVEALMAFPEAYRAVQKCIAERWAETAPSRSP